MRRTIELPQMKRPHDQSTSAEFRKTPPMGVPVPSPGLEPAGTLQVCERDQAKLRAETKHFIGSERDLRLSADGRL
jgi:hypothetical protein